MKSPETLAVLVLINMIADGMSLKCWKCIAHDCAHDPEENYKASKVSCEEGYNCMKVRYKMYDNVTHYDSVIRTCTASPCEMTARREFEECIATPKLYMIKGCSLRSCCSDRDLCNTATTTASTVSVIYSMLCMVVVSNCVTKWQISGIHGNV